MRGLGSGRAVLPGDVDGDGRTDAVIADDDGPYVVTGIGEDPAESRRISVPRLDVVWATLAVGDLNGDSFDDVVVTSDRHEVVVWPGSRQGTRPEPMIRITAADVGLSGSGTEAAFGSSLAVEDVDDDGYAELAIGAPEAEAAGVQGAGAVVVVPGGTDGPSTPAARILHQDSVHGSGDPEPGDGFGDRVEYRDLLPAEGPELFVVSPGEDEADGKVHLLASDGEVRQFRPEDAGIDQPGARIGDRRAG